MSSRPVWATLGVQGQFELHSKTVSQKTKGWDVGKVLGLSSSTTKKNLFSAINVQQGIY
jgi:hypothetical protein